MSFWYTFFLLDSHLLLIHSRKPNGYQIMFFLWKINRFFLCHRRRILKIFFRHIADPIWEQRYKRKIVVTKKENVENSIFIFMLFVSPTPVRPLSSSIAFSRAIPIFCVVISSYHSAELGRRQQLFFSHKTIISIFESSPNRHNISAERRLFDEESVRSEKLS